MKTTFISVLMILAAVLAKGEEIIQPVSIVANNVYDPTPDAKIDVNNLIDAKRINKDGLLHSYGYWSQNYLSNENVLSQDAWVYVDLGKEYDLFELRLWNYTDSDTDHPDTAFRGIKDISVWVASSGATLPHPGGKNFDIGKDGSDKFVNWTKVWSGYLEKRGNTSKKDPLPSSGFCDGTGSKESLQFGDNGKHVQYVGISIKNRWGEDPYTRNSCGLAYLQVYEKTCFSLESPQKRRSFISVTPVLKWSSPKQMGNVRYRVYLDTENADTEITDQDTDGNSGNCEFTPSTPLQPDTKYYWRVEAFNNTETISSSIWNFKTEPKFEKGLVIPVSVVANSYFKSYDGKHAFPSNLYQEAFLGDEEKFGFPVTRYVPRVYLSKSTDEGLPLNEQWLYFDLGGRYNLENLLIWNYSECYEISDTTFRSAKKVTIYVGDDVNCSELPKPEQRVSSKNNIDMPDAFYGLKGWEKVYQGTLTRGPSSQLTKEGDLIFPTDSMDLTGKVGRYIAIDIDSNYGDGSEPYVGLSHIQIRGSKIIPATILFLK